MGGRSSGSSAPTESKVIQSNLPEYVQPYFERLLQRGEAESNQPYTPYGGERISYFSPDELASQGMTRGYAQAGTPPEYQAASQRAFMLGGPYGSGYQAGQYGSGYQAGMMGPGYQAQGYGPSYQARSSGPDYNVLGYESNIDRFMNPYQQAVTDIAKREAIRSSDIMGDKVADAASMSGGLGGYREAIMQSERERNLGQQLSDIQTKGSLGAFQSAQAQLAAERQAQLSGQQFNLKQYLADEQSRQAQERFAQSGYGLQESSFQKQAQLDTQRYQAGEAARQQAAKLGLTVAQQNEAARQAQEKLGQSAFDMSQRYGLASVDALRNVGGDIQSDVRDRISALGSVGQQQRAMDQASLDMGYQDFLRQQGYGQQQLGMLGGLLQGVPVQPEQNISTYQQQPGLFQTAVGAGLSGLGLYRGMS
tara:strand:- start:1081 stop:2346 length:1266 start_codon:yes stop_codon:yes gene_type:complete